MKAKKQEEKIKDKINKELDRIEAEKKDTLDHMIKYINSEYASLNQYCKNEYPYSLETFSNRCMKYLPFYNNVSSKGKSNLKPLFAEEIKKLL
jgi:hypothetical protein